ncbi:MAG: hypothetical protein HYY41_05645 [Chloroflexi bacterium]|nr:hypothetical protein [Chloroflexota bacterium]
MFPSARWKAYLRSLQNPEKDNEATDGAEDHAKVIYHIYHSQMLWFTTAQPNQHQKAAEKHLKRCDELLAECNTLVDGLEETLANTPKPSEVMDWSSLW